MSAFLKICCVAITPAIVFAFPQSRETAAIYFENAALRVGDYYDRRPTETVLIVGNSRVFYHDMPYMLRRAADSAKSTIRYEILSLAYPAASLEDNWRRPEVREALAKKWDHIFLQANSGAQTSEEESGSFWRYGQKFVAAARETRSPVAFIVNWNYQERIFAESGAPANMWAQMRALYGRKLQDSHSSLARETGADLVNTGQAWESVLQQAPKIALYEDGNHPTLAGSYLSALMAYKFLAHKSAKTVSYAPNGLDSKDAAAIRAILD